jgi:hypothetical protein
MLQTPPALAMLAAWERGQQQGPVERGLTLLALASPDHEHGALEVLSIGERDRRLIALREALFGQRMTGLVTCERCGGRAELEFDARDLRAAEPAGDAALVLSADGYDLQLRLPDSRDLLAVAVADAARAPSVLLERCLVYARRGGETAAAADLPNHLVDAAGRRLADADPQADVRFSVTCPACSHAWSAPFDVVSYLWTELDAWAEHLLADVHVLASAYGWSETDILALSPARRQSYLRMAGA